MAQDLEVIREKGILQGNWLITKKASTMETIKSYVFEVRIGRTQKRVRATSTQALSAWAKKNEVNYWHMVGMMSREETEESKKLEIVA